MKDYNITKLTSELKSDNVQCRNKIIYIIYIIILFSIVLFWCRQFVTT